MARLLRTGLADPARVSAIDEAVLDAVAEGRSPATLHVYRRDAPTISLGRFTVIDDAVDLDYCQAQEIRIVRRLSAGGAIYTDPDQVLFGLAAPGLAGSPGEILETAGTRLADELQSRFGAEATFVPDNDIHVQGRKVSGMAIAIRRGVTLLHGTLVVDTDPPVMARALGGDPGRADDAVAGLAEILDRDVPMGEAEEAVIQALSGLVDEELVPRELSEQEEDRARHLVSTRYENDEWTYRR